MEVMGKESAGAIGFSISMDSLEELNRVRRDIDVDVVILAGKQAGRIRTAGPEVRKVSDDGSGAKGLAGRHGAYTSGRHQISGNRPEVLRG